MNNGMTMRETALVTGASSGIGAAIAGELAARGYDLIVTARRRERLDALSLRLQEAHGVHVEVVVCDLSRHGAAERFYAEVRALGRPLSLLVNNAGVGVYGKSFEVDVDAVLAMVELNVVALTTLTHRFGRDMLAAGRGRILQIASIAAFQPSPLYAVYAATKAFVLFMSAAIAYECRGSGLSITTVCPGLTESEFHARANHLKPRSMDRMYMSAEAVAKIAVDATMAGRTVVTPGLANKLAGTGVKWIPRSWAAAAAERMMRARREPDTTAP